MTFVLREISVGVMYVLLDKQIYILLVFVCMCLKGDLRRAVFYCNLFCFYLTAGIWRLPQSQRGPKLKPKLYPGMFLYLHLNLCLYLFLEWPFPKSVLACVYGGVLASRAVPELSLEHSCRRRG